MHLTNSFTVDVPAERLWGLLTDVEQIAPCVPGFTLTEVADPEYRGVMKVKVGAINMSYDATITFVERDDDAHRAVLSVRGKEKRGPGSVSATVTSTLDDQGERTTAEMVTDLQVTGRVAQFGRSILADVSGSLMEEFARCLDTRLLAPPEPEPAPAAAPTAAPAAAPRPPLVEAAPVDVGALTASAVRRRAALPLGAALAVLLAVLGLRALRSR